MNIKFGLDRVDRESCVPIRTWLESN